MKYNLNPPNTLRRDAGVTLVEVMIATFLVSIAAVLVVTMLTTALGIMRDVEARAGGEAEAQVIVSNMAWESRLAGR